LQEDRCFGGIEQSARAWCTTVAWTVYLHGVAGDRKEPTFADEMRDVAEAEQTLGTDATITILKLMLQSAEERCSVSRSLAESYAADSRRKDVEISDLRARLLAAYDALDELEADTSLVGAGYF
jgi:hypothetical protein